MRYRVEGHGGSMQITASPGEGTTISAWLPTLPS
jgi:signal transduction histidine kinase